MSRFLLPLIILMFTACVHDISIAPNISKVTKVRPVTIHRTVAYYIPKEKYKLTVETPAGNNDKLLYAPYQDTEPALKKVLTNIFTKMYKLENLDKNHIKDLGIKFIFIPEIETMSLSNSNVDWPPTKFNMVLKVQIINSDMIELFTSYAEGKGVANFGRYEENPTYAAEVASRSSFLQLQDEIITKRKRFK